MSAKHILIIDDEADIREVAQVSLEMVGGWRVSLARSGREGLALARTERPDAILLDVMMPDMDGPATFSKLQEDPAIRDIPVILLTARVTTGQPSPFAGLGVAAVIGKPFDPMSLANQVSRALGWES